MAVMWDGSSAKLTYLDITLESLPGDQGDLGLTRSEFERGGVGLHLGRHCDVDDNRFGI